MIIRTNFTCPAGLVVRTRVLTIVLLRSWFRPGFGTNPMPAADGIWRLGGSPPRGNCLLGLATFMCPIYFKRIFIWLPLLVLNSNLYCTNLQRVYLATLSGIITPLHGQSFEHPTDSETRSLPVAEHDVPPRWRHAHSVGQSVAGRAPGWSGPSRAGHCSRIHGADQIPTAGHPRAAFATPCEL